MFSSHPIWLWVSQVDYMYSNEILLQFILLYLPSVTLNYDWFFWYRVFFFFSFCLDKPCKECSQAIQNITLTLLSSGSLQNYFCIFLMWNSRSKQRLVTITDNKILTFSALLSISLMNQRSNFCFFLLLMYSGEIFTLLVCQWQWEFLFLRGTWKFKAQQHERFGLFLPAHITFKFMEAESHMPSFQN